MLIWFIVIGILGIAGIAKAPAILAALSPLPAISYLWHAGPLSLAVIGGAFLAVTGGEAFYADMGHFGPMPIRIAWFGVALPALTLNYFGQGGLLLTNPAAVENSFYQLAPEWSHYGLVTLATLATVIASQSIISGAYSMTRQAVQLGFLPRLNIVHTAGHEIGQIYVPIVNWALAIGTLAAVIGFGSSAALAGAFGIAVSLLMAITTLMATFVALSWKHNPLLVTALTAACSPWICCSWHRPRPSFWRAAGSPADLVRHRVPDAHLAQGPGDHGPGAAGDPEETTEFLERSRRIHRFEFPAPAMVLGRMTKGVPLPLTLNLKLNHVLHERVLLVAVVITETPRVADEERVRSADLRRHDSCRTAVRLHGEDGRSEGTWHRVGAQADLGLRSAASHLLHRPRDDHSAGPPTVWPAGARRSLRSCIAMRSGPAPISTFRPAN